MMGIYKITNPLGQVYIGQSKDIFKRLKAYKTLRCKKQPKIYQSLLAFGVNNHTVEILITCSEFQLNALEKYFQKMYNSLGKNGLNGRIIKKR